jgi:hypothetical protein
MDGSETVINCRDLSVKSPLSRATNQTMTRHVSGTYQRTDRVRVQPGATVRLRTEDRHTARAVTLIELSLSHLLLSSPVLPPVGANVGVTITLSERYIEFEVRAVVAWHRDGEFAVALDYLTARQTYGLTLAIALARQAVAAAAPALARVSRRR